jgi:hypothetical protein
MTNAEETRIERTIDRLKTVYFILACLSMFPLCWSLVLGTETERIPILLFNLGLFTLSYYGLDKRKSWAVGTVLIISVYFSFSYFLSVIPKMAGLDVIPGKIINILMFSFYAYQVVFLSTATVRKYFKESGSSIF